MKDAPSLVLGPAVCVGCGRRQKHPPASVCGQSSAGYPPSYYELFVDNHRPSDCDHYIGSPTRTIHTRDCASFILSPEHVHLRNHDRLFMRRLLISTFSNLWPFLCLSLLQFARGNKTKCEV